MKKQEKCLSVRRCSSPCQMCLVVRLDRLAAELVKIGAPLCVIYWLFSHDNENGMFTFHITLMAGAADAYSCSCSIQSTRNWYTNQTNSEHGGSCLINNWCSGCSKAKDERPLCSHRKHRGRRIRPANWQKKFIQRWHAKWQTIGWLCAPTQWTGIMCADNNNNNNNERGHSK